LNNIDKHRLILTSPDRGLGVLIARQARVAFTKVWRNRTALARGEEEEEQRALLPPLKSLQQTRLGMVG
jgi:hypothetical protein